MRDGVGDRQGAGMKWDGNQRRMGWEMGRETGSRDAVVWEQVYKGWGMILEWEVR